MTWLTRLSLRNRALVGLAAVLVAVFGVISMTSLKQELIPSLQIPIATVIAPAPGTSPAVVEQQITAPIESAAKGVNGVTGVRSTSSGGISVVNVEMDYGTDLTGVQRDLQQAVGALTGLPQGVEPSVVTGSTDSFPVLQLAASSEMPPAELNRTLREQVTPLLEEVEGVDDVSLTGLGERMVTIDLQPAALALHGVSPLAVGGALQANGVRLPAGTVGAGDRELSVQVGAPITTLDDLRDLYVPSGRQGGAPVRLGEIAEVSSQFETATGYARTDGRPSIGIGVTKTADGNTVEVSHAVQDLVPQIRNLLGPGAAVTVVFDQAPFIEQSISDLTTEGMLGLAFAVLVILLFLLSLRSTLVTAISIPMSLLIALIALYVNDYSLNILTLGALTIAVGRVVDDSIVVIENIKRHLGYGEPIREAVVSGVREVASAITASTVTTVAVFLPIGLVSGQVGELFRPFAITVTAALLASLLVSLTIVPVLASWFLHRRRKAPPVDRAQALEQERRNPLQRGYLPVLRAAVGRPVITCLVAVAVLGGTVAMVPQLKTNFLSDSGQNTFQISQEMPPGTGLAATDAAARRVERVLQDTPGVQSYATQVGSPDSSSPLALGGQGVAGNSASYFVTTDVDADQTALKDQVRSRLTALDDIGTVTVQSGEGGPGAGKLEVVVRAENERALTQAAGQVERALRDVPGATDVTNNLADQQPTVDVAIDRRAAAAAGLSDQQIGQAVATALRGSPAGTAAIDGEEQQVVVRTGFAPSDLDALRALPLGPVRLGDVAQVREVAQAASITRLDGSRSATITATPDADDLGSVTADLQQRLDDLTLPAGATAEIGGVSADQSDAFGQLGLALLLAVAIVYLVMVATFRSLIQPLLLLVSIPFAATGALGLLLLTDTPLGVPALIGMLMLIGIVVTNAIVLIDLVNQYRESGASIRDAVIDGARRRLRPILMTAVATICALFPMSLGLSGGGLFISQPLAIVVIGGLISSTLLTLVLVPVLYSLVERARERLRHGTRGAPAADVAPETVPQAPVAVPAAAAPAPVGAAPTGAAPAAPARAPVGPRAGAPVPAGAGVPVATPAPTPVSTPTSPPRAHPGGPGAARPHSGPAAGPPAVDGTVTGADGAPRAGAVLTLVGADGEQVAHTVSSADGGYVLPAPTPGSYLLICQGTAGDGDPQATWISVEAQRTRHDVVLAGPVGSPH